MDADQDGYGTDAGTTTQALDGSCDTADGESGNMDDCDDANAAINPEADEVFGDGIDQDCDGVDGLVCFLDEDQDGYGGDSGTTVVATTSAISVWIANISSSLRSNALLQI